MIKKDDEQKDSLNGSFGLQACFVFGEDNRQVKAIKDPSNKKKSPSINPKLHVVFNQKVLSELIGYLMLDHGKGTNDSHDTACR